MSSKRPTFKRYDQQQIMLLPPSLEELVPKDHPVRVVNDVINRINIAPLNAAYQYPPKQVHIFRSQPIV